MKKEETFGGYYEICFQNNKILGVGEVVKLFFILSFPKGPAFWYSQSMYVPPVLYIAEVIY